MDTRRFSIELTKSEIEILQRVAEQERRPLRDQAAYMLAQCLKQQAAAEPTYPMIGVIPAELRG